MKNLSLFILFLSFNTISFAQATSVYSYSTTSIDGDSVFINQYAGKKLMFVNTASFCSFTHQFAELEQLYKDYKSYNFEILGFPCNDFGNQDSLSDSLIDIFCTTNYGVTFKMMSKMSVSGQGAEPVYNWLQQAFLNGKQSVNVDWNFNKFLVNESGEWIAHYSSETKPLDPVITHWITTSELLTDLKEVYKPTDFFEIISPNPTNSSIDVLLKQAQPYTFYVFSMEGQLMSKTSSSPVSDKFSIDISELSNGIYFLKVDSGSVQDFSKIIVAK